MTINSRVRILREDKKPRKGYSEWRQDYAPRYGAVEYISPHDWALVRVRSRLDNRKIYRGAFWITNLEGV